MSDRVLSLVSVTGLLVFGGGLIVGGFMVHPGLGWIAIGLVAAMAAGLAWMMSLVLDARAMREKDE